MRIEVCAWCALALSAPMSRAAASYGRVPIPVPAGHTVRPVALNERGQVLGHDCDTTAGRGGLFLSTESPGGQTILSYSTSPTTRPRPACRRF